MDWHPHAAESVLYRTAVRFSSGLAAPVSGLRSFRDFDRRDIRRELPGWPDIPPFVPHTKKAQAADRTMGGILRAVPLAIAMAVEWFGGNTYSSGPGPSDGRNEPQEPEDEVEDFPVIWADPGTVARTLPWQLNAANRPARLVTDLVLTDRRLLVIGHESDPSVPADVLWETPRNTVATAERRDFSKSRADLKIVFTDRSWTRLRTGSASDTTRLVHHLLGTARLLTESDLSSSQRERVDAFMAGLPTNAEPPTLTELPSGVVDVESRVPNKRIRGAFSTHHILMGSGGEPAPPRPGDVQ